MTSFYIVLASILAFNALLLGALIAAFHSPRFARHWIHLGPTMKVPLAARLRSVAVSSVISLAAVLGATYFLRGALFADHPLALGVKAAQAAGILVVYDFTYYWLHRGMHHKRVMRLVHGVHHRAKNPSALESFYLHPLELLAGLSLLMGSTWLVGPVDTSAFAVAFFVYSTLNIVIHSGLSPRAPALSSAHVPDAKAPRPPFPRFREELFVAHAAPGSDLSYGRLTLGPARQPRCAQSSFGMSRR